MALECSISTLTGLDQTDPDAVQALLQACTAALLDPLLWKWALAITFGCALVGAFIGYAKGRWLAGFVWGAALGPIGWLIVMFSKSGRIECPDCGRTNVPNVKACRHCGVNLKSVAMRSQRSQVKNVDSNRRW